MARNMHLVDDDTRTLHSEHACVRYKDAGDVDEGSAPSLISHKMKIKDEPDISDCENLKEITECMFLLSDDNRLTEVPRVNLADANGFDVCDPTNEDQLAHHESWLKVMATSPEKVEETLRKQLEDAT